MQAAARDLKRDSILIAAIEVFIEEGYDLASMDRIAERAEIFSGIKTKRGGRA